LAVDAQPFSVAVTVRPTLPTPIGEKVTACVNWPPVMVPPVMVQLYVAFGDAGTLATWLVLPAQTLAGAEITVEGAVVTGMMTEPLDVQLPFVTTTPTVTLLPVPAAKVMAAVPWPDVIEPPVTDQL
jgi:hypothetical protein